MDLAVDRAKLKELYMPGVEDFMFVDVPEMPFAVIDGTGAPDDAIKRLFVAIQPIRRQARAELGKLPTLEPGQRLLGYARAGGDLPLL